MFVEVKNIEQIQNKQNCKKAFFPNVKSLAHIWLENYSFEVYLLIRKCTIT